MKVVSARKFRFYPKMEPEVIWIGIDPNLLIEGFDYQGFFGADCFLKFNLDPEETDHVEDVDGSQDNTFTTNHIEDDPQSQDLDSKTNFTDNDPESEQIDSKNPSITKQIESETRFNSDDDKIEHKEGIDNIKKEQNIKPEFDPDIKPLNQTNKGIAIPSECPECGITLSSISKLTTHLIDVHKTEKLFPCDHCDKKFSRKHFKEHRLQVVEKQFKVSCKMCEQTFARGRDLERHKSKAHPEEVSLPYQCSICLKILRSNESLKYHEMQNHREYVAQCGTCSRKFSTKKNYEMHMLQASCDRSKRKRDKQCDQCDMRFRRKHDLDCHIEARHSDKQYQCELCPKVVKSYRRLKYHKMEQHSEEKHVCATCHYRFVRKESLEAHTQAGVCVSRTERQKESKRNGDFKCTIDDCGKKYSTKTHLKRHIMTHTNERPHQCEDCGMAFTQAGSLKEHIRTHTGEKPYQCSECPNAYAQSGTFKAHMRSHQNVETEVKTRGRPRGRPRVEINVKSSGGAEMPTTKADLFQHLDEENRSALLAS